MNYSSASSNSFIQLETFLLQHEGNVCAMARLSYIVAALCWLLVSLAPGHAVGTAGLMPINSAVGETAKIEACHKLVASTPTKHQCNGVPAQTAATARSRHDGKDKTSPVRRQTREPFQLNERLIRTSAKPKMSPATRQRRSNFWRIFPISMRLRN